MPRLVAQVRVLVPSRIPYALDRIHEVITTVRGLVVSYFVENKEFELRSEKRGIPDAGALEIGRGLLRYVARVAGIRLACYRVYDIADYRQGRVRHKRVDSGRLRIGYDKHVACMYRLPSPDARSAESETVIKSA